MIGKILRFVFKCRYGTCKGYCRCGKGGATIVQSTPPPQPSTGDAIKEWVNALPQIYETQFKYAPQEAQQQVELAQQYALPLAEAYQTTQEKLYPGTTALQEQLATQSQEGMTQGLSQQERDMYASDIKGLLGENVSSPIGADYYGRGLLQMEQQRKDYFRNLGLSMTGRQPLTQAATPQTNQFGSSFNPQDVMGYTSNNYGTFASASRPLGYYQNPTALDNAGKYAQIGGSLLGGMGMMGL